MSDTVKVTVAVVGAPTALQETDADGVLLGLQHPADWKVAYADRLKIDLEVSEDTTLGEVLRRAAQKAGVLSVAWESWDTYTPALVAFYREDRDPDFGRLHREVALLDDAGRVRWTHRWDQEPMGEYLRAAAAGVVDGDPRRPYLLLQPPMGNGILADFPTFVELWKLWWDVADKVAIVGGLYAAWDAAKRRMGPRAPTPTDGPEIVDSLYEGWKTNGGRPDNLVELLGQRPWHPGDLADVLGCTQEQAEALLMGFGHERRSDGLWAPGTSPAAKLLRGNAQFVIHAGMTTTPEAVEAVLRERGETYRDFGTATEEIAWQTLDLPYDSSRLEAAGVRVADASTMKERLEVVLRYRAASALHRIRHRFHR